MTLRLYYALLLENSPWKTPKQQLELIAPLLQTDSHQRFLVTQPNCKKQITMTHLFSELLRLYDYLVQHATNHDDSDDNQRARQNDFMVLLTKLSRKEITTIDTTNRPVPHIGPNTAHQPKLQMIGKIHKNLEVVLVYLDHILGYKDSNRDRVR